MGAFTNSAITDAGRALLAEAQAGAVFTPTRLVIGSGSIPTGKTAQTMTDVVAVVKSLAINKKQRTPDGKAIFGAVYSNEDITEAFYFRELALYAKPVHLNEDGSVASEGAEVLYTYGNAGDNADYMPAYSTSTVVEKQIDIVTYVGNNTQVNLTIESGTYIQRREMGAAGGVASLDEVGKLHEEQLPNDVPVLANGSTMYLNDKAAAVSASNGRAVLNSYKTPGSNAEYRGIVVRNRNETEELSQAFCLGINDGNGYELLYAIYGEHNKPTAADVGAVSTDGSTMHGTLNVAIDGGNAVLVSDAACAYLQTFLDGDWENRRTLLLRNEQSAAVENMLTVAAQKDGEWHEYSVIHEGNKSLVKPVDIGAAITTTYTATVTTTWTKTSDGDYYYQGITIPGLLETDNPIVDILTGSDNAANTLYIEEFRKVFRIRTYDNSVQMFATEKTNTAFQIQLKVVR
jgi:hypothetical protein